MKEYYFTEASLYDLVLSLFISLFIIGSILFINKNKSISNTIERYKLPAVLVKIIGGYAFAFIYLYYYVGGDTIDYFSSANAMGNLFWKNPGKYFDLMFNQFTYEKYFSYFDSETLWPTSHLLTRNENINVFRIASVFSIITNKGFLTTTIIFSYMSFFGIWKLYKIFCELYPVLYKQLAVAFLFIPSFFFWGSGIMKDTIAVYGMCLLVASYYNVFILKRNRVKESVYFSIAILIIMGVKGYILVALTPGLIILLLFNRFNKIKNAFLRTVSFPVFIFLLFVAGSFIFVQASGLLGYSSTNQVLERAVIIQKDLKRADSYGANFFDIGELEPTIGSFISHAPLAINAGIYRPYIWEARNPVMLISGLENLILLLFTLYSLIKLRFIYFFAAIFKDPLLLLCVSFTVILAFFIGITTANFGALVRYKIPFLPFFVSFFIILNHYTIQKRSEKK